MRKKYLLPLLLLFLALSPLLLAGINKRAQPVNGILLPRIGFPAFIEPNTSFKVVVVGNFERLRPSIENDLYTYELTVEEISYNSSENLTHLTLRAGNVEEGLYSLVLEADDKVMREPNCVAVKRSWDLPLTVFWISDTHYDNTRGQLHLAARFRRHIWTINFFSPDFAIITGDVCNNPPEELFIGAYRELMKLQRPIILIPGNHDHSLKGDFFTKYLAPSNASLNVGPIHVICLDTGPGSLSGNITLDQKEWLVEDLRSASEKPVKILLIHHPLFTIWNSSEVSVAEIMEVLVRYNVTMVLSGHMHENYVFEEPILCVTNPNSYGHGVGRALPGFRVFTITPSGEVEWLKGLQNPIYLDEFDITIFQANDGEAKGFSARIRNKLPMQISGKFEVKLATADKLESEGASIQEVKRTRDGKYVVTLAVDVKPNQEKLVKLWSEEDVDPPHHVSISTDISYGAAASIIWVNVTARDEVLGVENVTLKYSVDNKSWNSVQLLRLNETLFSGRLQVPRDVSTVYYTIEAVDAGGKVRVEHGKIKLMAEEVEREEIGPSYVKWKLVAILALVLIILIVTITRLVKK